MRKILLSAAVIMLLLSACAREPLTDPVLFCESFNRSAWKPIVEEDAMLRAENEVMLFSANTVIRLKLNEDGAIHTAVVTGKTTDETTSVIENAFAVLAQPLSESVPRIVSEPPNRQSVQTVKTRRFYYAIYCEDETVTAVQVNLLLCSIPDLPSLRLSESE